MGTIKYFREKLNRKNVTPDKVTKSFEGTKQFFLSIGKAYLLEAAMEFFMMHDLNDKIGNNAPPAGILHMATARKREYFDEVIGAFVDQFVMADPDHDATFQMQELHDRSTHVAAIGHDHDYSSAPPPAEVLNVDEEQIEEDQSGTDKVR